jgi:two-component system, cell cycle response regulator
MKYRVLVADDDMSIRTLIAEVLGDDGFDVTTAANGEEAWQKFDKESYEIVLTDIRMPLLDGLQLLQKIRTKSPMTRVLILTSFASVASSVQALKDGAFDYLIKPFESLDAVSCAVRRAVEHIELARKREAELVDSLIRKNMELGQLNKVFHDLASRDGLTGLYNHRFVQNTLQLEFERAQTTGSLLSVIVLDVDHFKDYNDTHGHLMGDYVLKSLADLLQQNVRDIDIVARWGGEEFVIVCPKCTAESAHALAARLCKTIAAHPFEGRETQPKRCISVSVGVAAMTLRTLDPSELIRAADAAVYEVKRNGRDGVRLMAE